jgi:hypothetical protein
MPTPRIRRQMSNVCHEWVNPEAIGVAMRIRAVMKMVPRRPNKLFRGSESQQPLWRDAFSRGFPILAQKNDGRREHAQEGTANVRRSVDETNNPSISLVVRVAFSRVDAKLYRERQVGLIKGDKDSEACAGSHDRVGTSTHTVGAGLCKE